MAAATRKWRTPEDVRAETGLIGPNAVLQYLPVIDRLGGPERVAGVLARAGIAALPDGTAMIPEGDAARLHRQIRLDAPDRAADLAAEAGRRTADYILAHRIPGPAKRLLKLLPPPLAAAFLARAIARHAWTFAGSGRFGVENPWTFRIAGNPLIRGERADRPICHWHAAVFARLYQDLVAADCTCIETSCAAEGGRDLCVFELRRPL